ncbi:hypothetical protein GIB67_000078, partial [Kingdonia uniflora]
YISVKVASVKNCSILKTQPNKRLDKGNTSLHLLQLVWFTSVGWIEDNTLFS